MSIEGDRSILLSSGSHLNRLREQQITTHALDLFVKDPENVSFLKYHHYVTDLVGACSREDIVELSRIVPVLKELSSKLRPAGALVKDTGSC
jgi:hypothetical protein